MENSILEESKKARERRWFGFVKSKKFLFLVVIILILAAVYFFFFKKNETTNQVSNEPKEWTVKQDDLQIAVESDGQVVAKDGVELSFSVSGDTLEVSEVYVDEGDTIAKGDKIASVKTDDLEYDLNKAYVSYQAALASYNEAMAGATEKEIAEKEASVEQAEISLEQQKISLEKTKISAENSIKDAEEAVEDAKEDLSENQNELTSEDVEDAYESLVDTLKSVNISLTSILLSSDKILGIDDKAVNDDFEDLLGAKDFQALNKANSTYQSAKEEMNELDSLVVGTSFNSAYEEIDEAAEQAINTLETFETHLYYMQSLLEATIISSDFTQSELDGFKSTINSNRSSINTKISSVNNAIETVADAKEGLEDYVTAYEDALDNLEDTKVEAEQDIANAESNVRNKELSLEQAQDNLDDLLAPLTESELASLKSSLTSAVVSLNKAQSDLEKATLTSPIDGEIAALNYKAGDIIITDNNTPVVSIINNNTLFIEVNIEESDINKLTAGQKAYATFDAADGLELEGEVSFISLTSETSSNGIVTYPVKVLFQNTDDGQIREGMTASVNFITAGVADVLIVPVDAVRNVNGSPSVESVDGEWLPVTTGFTDGDYVEIISGLEIGDIILY